MRTLQSLIDEIKIKLQYFAPQVGITDKYLEFLINKQAKELSKKFYLFTNEVSKTLTQEGEYKWNVKESAIDLINGYILSVSFDKKVLDYTTTFILDAISPNWRSEKGTPSEWYILDINTIGIYPALSKENINKELKVEYNRYCKEITTTQSSELPEDLDNLVVLSVVIDILSIEKEITQEKLLRNRELLNEFYAERDNILTEYKKLYLRKPHRRFSEILYSKM